MESLTLHPWESEVPGKVKFGGQTPSQKMQSLPTYKKRWFDSPGHTIDQRFCLYQITLVLFYCLLSAMRRLCLFVCQLINKVLTGFWWFLCFLTGGCGPRKKWLDFGGNRVFLVDSGSFRIFCHHDVGVNWDSVVFTRWQCHFWQKFKSFGCL